jgi:hypothetical protein
MQAYIRFVLEHLPTAVEIRRRISREKKEAKQAYYERRFKCRDLIFRKGKGLVKNLTLKEKQFCNSVLHEAFECYREELRTGKSRWRCKGPKWQKPLNPNRGHDLSLLEYRKIWMKGNKAVYVHRDIPKIMKERVERMRTCGVEVAN